jgi:hypothetical protein
LRSVFCPDVVDQVNFEKNPFFPDLRAGRFAGFRPRAQRFWVRVQECRGFGEGEGFHGSSA